MIAIMKTDLTRCLAGTFIIVIILIGVLCSVFLVDRNSVELKLGELKQVHVIFSHGERTPTVEEIQLFPLSASHNETFFPYGYGALTNDGKMRMYKLGVKLKELYGEFLGDNYKQTNYIMQSMNTDISKMSALLVSSGLWPTDEMDDVWNIYQWQPIPYQTMKEENDFMHYEVNCPRFTIEKQKVTHNYMAHNDVPYEQLFDLLGLYTGANITEFSQVVKLTEFMEAQRPFTNSTPKWYTNLENIINNVVITDKKLNYQKPLMKEFSSGYLLKKVYSDSKNEVEETLRNVMYCYSANVNNIAALLADTNMKHLIPKLGSAFIIEMYSTISDYNQHVYKFFYYDGISPELSTVKLNRCVNPCFLHNFKNLVSKTLHKDYATQCNTYV